MNKAECKMVVVATVATVDDPKLKSDQKKNMADFLGDTFCWKVGSEDH